MENKDTAIMVVGLAGAFWWLALAWWKGVLKTPPTEPTDDYPDWFVDDHGRVQGP